MNRPVAVRLVPSGIALTKGHRIVSLRQPSTARPALEAPSSSSHDSHDGAGPSSITSSSSSFEDLSVTELSSFLRGAIQASNRVGSFTFSVAGNVLRAVSRNAQEGGGAGIGTPLGGKPQAQRAAACMHILPRRAGDFVPNNRVYHELRWKFALPLLLPSDVEVVKQYSPWVQWFYQLDNATVVEGTLAATHQPSSHPQKGEEEEMGSSKFPRVPEKALAHRDAWERENLSIPSSTSVNFLPLSTFQADEPARGSWFTFFPFRNAVDDCVPFTSEHFAVLVNLKPIVPFGHLMIVPKRILCSVHDFTAAEVEDWGYVLRLCMVVLRDRREDPREEQNARDSNNIVEEEQDDGFSVAIQQGVDAGQTVFHQHTHVIVFSATGALAGEPEPEEAEQQRRQARTAAEMREETEYFRRRFQKAADSLTQNGSKL